MLSPSEIQVVQLSLSIAIWVVVLSLGPGWAVAWWLARTRTRWRALVHGIVLLPLVLPPVVTGYALLALFGRSTPIGKAWHYLTGDYLSYSFSAAVLAAAVVSFPLLVESLRIAFESIDPRLEKIARSLGMGRARTWWRVSLPLALPGVFAGTTLAFARALGEFGATIVLAGNIEGETRQIPVAVYSLLQEPGSAAAVWRLSAISVGLSLGALALTAWLRARGARKAGQA